MTERRNNPDRRAEMRDRRNEKRDRRGDAKLHRLSIDFSRNARRSPWVGRVLMAVAAAVALDAGLAYRDAKHVIDRNREELAKAPSAPAQRASKEEVAQARDTVERLAMPWAGLFGALESAATEQVALLAVEPDAKAGKVLISGEGRDYLAALTYVLNLSRSDALSGVQLVRHEMKPEDPQKPVAFAVSATWKEGAQ
jgi:hypothetical protein